MKRILILLVLTFGNILALPAGSCESKFKTQTKVNWGCTRCVTTQECDWGQTYTYYSDWYCGYEAGHVINWCL